MRINGVDYPDKEMDFTNVLCDLEDKGIEVMNMSGGGTSVKMFSLCRGIVSLYTGEDDLKKCGAILTEHLANGGTMDEIFAPFEKAMTAAGFGKAAEPTTAEPQDHRKPNRPKIPHGEE